MYNAMPLQNALDFVVGTLIALLLLPAGIGKIKGLAGVTGYIAFKGVPGVQIAAAVVIAIVIGLGSLPLFGWQMRWVALGIAFFTVVLIFIFRSYWSPTAEVLTVQKLHYKNLAFIGELLSIAACRLGGFIRGFTALGLSLPRLHWTIRRDPS